MSILLWVLQGLLAVHTAIGAIWKFSKSAEETMPSLKAIPNGVWTGMSVLELFIALLLVLPLLYKPAAPLVPVVAMLVVAEMLVFCGLHLSSGATDFAPMIYWLVVALLCGFIAFGRFKLSPL